MKALWSLILVIFLFTIYGCEEDVIIPVEPPVVIDPVVKGEAYALPASIVAGETTTITYTGSKDVTSVTINGTTVSATAGSKSYALTITTTFTVKFIGPNNLVDEKSFTVNVDPNPDAARTDSLCLKKYWKTTSIRYIDANGIWHESNLSEEELSIKEFYYANGTMESIRPSDGKLIGNGKWNWVGKDSIKCGDVLQYKFVNTSLLLSQKKGTVIMTLKSYSL